MVALRCSRACFAPTSAAGEDLPLEAPSSLSTMWRGGDCRLPTLWLFRCSSRGGGAWKQHRRFRCRAHGGGVLFNVCRRHVRRRRRGRSPRYSTVDPRYSTLAQCVVALTVLDGVDNCGPDFAYTR